MKFVHQTAPVSPPCDSMTAGLISHTVTWMEPLASWSSVRHYLWPVCFNFSIAKTGFETKTLANASVVITGLTSRSITA